MWNDTFLVHSSQISGWVSAPPRDGMVFVRPDLASTDGEWVAVDNLDPRSVEIVLAMRDDF